MNETQTTGVQYPWHGIIGWAYEASLHCNFHAIARFTESGLFAEDTEDSEGNPLHPVCSWDEEGNSGDYCDECLHEAIVNKTPAEYANLRG